VQRKGAAGLDRDCSGQASVQRKREQRMAASALQRKLAQRAEALDDELLQGKFATTQLAGPEGGELLQGKFETVTGSCQAGHAVQLMGGAVTQRAMKQSEWQPKAIARVREVDGEAADRIRHIYNPQEGWCSGWARVQPRQMTLATLWRKVENNAKFGPDAIQELGDVLEAAATIQANVGELRDVEGEKWEKVRGKFNLGKRIENLTPGKKLQLSTDEHYMAVRRLSDRNAKGRDKQIGYEVIETEQNGIVEVWESTLSDAVNEAVGIIQDYVNMEESSSICEYRVTT